MSLLPAEATPFHFAGDRRGVLLVHGFTGSPFEMRLLGEHLAARGYTVSGPLLAGHGDSPQALNRTRSADWLATVEAAFEDLASRSDRVAVVGLSLGGLLSLELGRRHGPRITALASLAAPLWLAPWIMRTIRLLGPSLGGLVVPKWSGSDIADPHLRRRNPTMSGAPLGAAASLLDFMEHVRRHLGEIDRPTFLAHARLDHTAPYDCMEVIARCLGSSEIETLVLERSYHVVTLDHDRELLFARLETFLARHLG